MTSFADIQVPTSVPYSWSGSTYNRFGFDISFIGEQYFDSTIVANGLEWDAGKTMYVVSNGEWKEVKEAYVNSGGIWKSTAAKILNTNRVQRIRMWAYRGTLPTTSNPCGSLTNIYNTDDGAPEFNFAFPYEVPAGYRLTRFATAWAADDGVGDIRFTNAVGGARNDDVDFPLALNRTSFTNNSTADIYPQPNGGCNSVHIHTENWPTFVDSCINCRLKDRVLGHRFSFALNNAYPIMTHAQNHMRLNKSSQSDCTNCESNLKYIYIEFHSGNAITNDNGNTWTAPTVSG